MRTIDQSINDQVTADELMDGLIEEDEEESSDEQPIVYLRIRHAIADIYTLEREQLTSHGNQTVRETCHGLQQALDAARLHKGRYESFGWDVRD